MNQALQELTQKTDKTIKAKDRKIRRIKETVKQVTWTILMILFGASCVLNYYQWQDFRSDYLKAEVHATRIIENRHADVVKKQEEKDSSSATDVQPQQEELSPSTPLSVEDQIRKVATEEGFTDADLLVKIASCESSLNPRATNTTSSAKGLFQILDMHGLSIDERFDVETATRWTINCIEDGKLSFWNASKECWS